MNSQRFETVVNLPLGHGAQPGELAFGELAGGGDGLLAELLGADVAVQVMPGLAVAHGADRGQRGAEVAALAKDAHFVEKTGGQHLLESLGDARVQHAAIRRFQREDAQGQGVVIRAPGSQMRRERPTAELPHFQRALDALGVARSKAGRGDRIDFGQPGVQRGPAEPGGLGVEFGAHGRIGLRQFGQAGLQRLEVEQGAADDQGLGAALANFLDKPARVRSELRRAIALRRVEDVEQVVHGLGALVSAGLGGADIHAAIDQRRVHADEFHGFAALSGLLDELQSRGGFAAGSRADEAENRLWGLLSHGFSARAGTGRRGRPGRSAARWGGRGCTGRRVRCAPYRAAGRSFLRA